MVDTVAGPRSRGAKARLGRIRFLVAATASFYGDWLTTVGLVVLLYQITGSTAAPAAYVVVRLAPRFLGAGPAGSLADRFGPVRLIAVSWVLQGVLTLAIIPLASTRSLVAIYVAVAGAQFLNAIARPSMNAAIPLVVSPKGIRRFNGMFAAAESTSVFVAPAIGSVLLLVSGVQLLLLLDGLTFIVGAGLMASLRVSQPDSGGSTQGDAGHRLEGARVVLGDPLLRTIAATFLAGALAVAATQSVMVVAAAERFGSGNAVGWLYSAVGAGALVASVFLIKRPPRRISRASIAAMGVIEVAPLGALAYVHSFVFAAALLGLSAAAGIFSETWGSIDLQERVPRHLLGRVNGAVFIALYLGMMAGAGSGVVLAPLLHWDRALPLISAIGVAIILLASLSPANKRAPSPLRDFPE